MPRTLDQHLFPVRWMIRKDMEEVTRIENGCFEFPWTEDQIISCLRQRNCIGMVAEDKDERVVGYMIYELHRTRLQLLNFAVHPRFHRVGVGSSMMRKLLAKLSPRHRNQILCEIRETNLDAQLFFKSRGFRCISTLRNFYQDTDEDAYLFQYRV